MSGDDKERGRDFAAKVAKMLRIATRNQKGSSRELPALSEDGLHFVRHELAHNTEIVSECAGIAKQRGRMYNVTI